MNFLAQRTAYFGLAALFASGLVACDKNDYTTWVCNSSAATAKVTMVLSHSVMTLDPPQILATSTANNTQSNLRFCGSLGNDSYFDTRCPPDTKSALVRFTPGTGVLRLGTQTMQCTVL